MSNEEQIVECLNRVNRKSFVLKIILTVLFFVLFVFIKYFYFTSEAVVINKKDSELVNEIMAIRETNKSANIDVSDIVRRYIKIGFGANEAIPLLESYGFVVFEDSHKGKNYIFAKNQRKRDFIGFGDDIAIVCEITDGRVSSVSGTIIYRAF